jgi:Uma2 family endonuclease
MSTVQTSPVRSFVMEDVDWRTYSRLLRIFEDRPAVRLAYDRGRLEIMSPRPEHEYNKSIFGYFVFILADELGLKFRPGGSTTYRRRRKKRGIEPDDSWWIASESRVRGKLKINLKVDPPPDLAVEVDLTNSSLDRLHIYAALKIPEVWRLDGGCVTFQLLGTDGKYAEASESLSFPGLKPGDLMHFLALAPHTEAMDLLHQFRAWVRQRIADGWK